MTEKAPPLIVAKAHINSGLQVVPKEEGDLSGVAKGEEGGVSAAAGKVKGKVNTSTFSGRPLESEFLAGMSTFCKVEIYKILIGNPRFICHSLKIGNGVFVEAESHLFFHVLGVWISDRIREIIFLFHKKFPYCWRSLGVAFLAEMILTSFSSSL